MELKQRNPDLKIYGPFNENIPECDFPVSGGDEVTTFGPNTIQIIDVGGHTNGHIAYYFPDDRLVFSGDALFALGCGKMFEGNPTQFWESLKRLRALPDETVGMLRDLELQYFVLVLFNKDHINDHCCI